MPHRRLFDAVGRLWDVWETRPGPRSRVSPVYRDGWLTFETVSAPTTKRRLAPIPDAWDRLSDVELLILLERGTPIEIRDARTTMMVLEESSAPEQLRE